MLPFHLVTTAQELYSEIVVDEIRNQLIVDDVVKSFENGRYCIVLTERIAHVELLAKKLSERIPDVITLTGGMSTKHTRKILEKIAEAPTEKRLTLVATGKYIGEGFDEPRLDTLFLAMPISSIDIIFDKSNFLPVFSNDIVNAAREILIVSPFAAKKRTLQMLQYLDAALRNMAITLAQKSFPSPPKCDIII